LVTYRHDSVKQLLARLLRHAAIDVRLEPRAVYNDERRPDLCVAMGSRQILIDVSVRHPFSPTYLHSNLAMQPLGVALDAERRKRARYQSGASAANMEFVPFVLETTGGWGPAAVAFTRSAATHAADFTSNHRTSTLNQLTQGLSMAVQRGNAQLLLGAYQLALAHNPIPDITRHNPPRAARPLQRPLLPPLPFTLPDLSGLDA
jgi:hypothetical protein